MPLLRERGALALEYLNGADVQFSDMFERIMRHSFGYADPLGASLVLWACDACGGDTRSALPLAASVECFQRFCALHDELQLPPTVLPEPKTTSSIWGLAQTLNAGDAFHAMCLELLGRDAVHGDERTLDAGIMVANAVLLGVERRDRLVRSARGHRRRRMRVAHDGTQVVTLSLSLRVGARMAEASPELSGSLERAGRLLGIVVQLASQARGKSSPLAQRYARKAVELVERSPLRAPYQSEFREIAYGLAAGN
ncbi:MAG TPA: hypothetical protein VMF11_13835 [Candidatus Baltobacteraceae bacterium]|nr:hypothetical protein [Candidatus Baltobacteraceae bacterium]